VLCVAAVMSLHAPAMAQLCEGWIPTDSWSSLGDVESLAAVDHDGPGPQGTRLYAVQIVRSGGYFMETLFASEGQRWTQVPGLVTEESREFRVVLSIDQDTAGIPAGSLLVVGRFRALDGSVSNAAIFDGATFAPIDLAGHVIDRAVVFDPDGEGPQERVIAAAGTFNDIGGQPATSVATWDGVQWTPLGNPDFPVTTLRVLDLDGPAPQSAKLVSAAGVPRWWDGASWQALGDVAMLDLEQHDPDGPGPEPQSIFGIRTQQWMPRLDRWDGQGWQRYASNWPASHTGAINRLQSFDPDGPGPRTPQLVGVGSFEAQGNQVGTVAVCNTEGWSFPPHNAIDCCPNSPGELRDGMWVMLAVDPDGDGPRSTEVLIGGGANSVAGWGLGGVMSWNGDVLVPVQNALVGESIRCFQVFDADDTGPDGPRIFAAGRIGFVNGGLAAALAEWRDGAWRGLGNHDHPNAYFRTIRQLAVIDLDGEGPDAASLVGLNASDAGGVGVWRDGAWQPLGSMSNMFMNSIRAFDEDGPGPGPARLFVAGQSNQSCFRVLSGGQWVDAGTPRAGVISWLHEHDPDGDGPLPAMLLATSYNGVSRWTGSDWVAYGGTVAINNFLPSFGEFDHTAATWDSDGDGPLPAELVIASTEIITPDGTFRGATAFDGVRWRQLGPARTWIARRIEVVDPDGGGPELPQVVVGFTYPARTQGIARLVGGAWVDLAGFANPLTNDLPMAIAGYAPGVEGPSPGELFIGGIFTDAGGLPANRFARWRTQPCCDPDVNCDGAADQGDVACIILSVAGDASCFCQTDPDFNLDGSADQGDVAALIGVVAGGECP